MQIIKGKSRSDQLPPNLDADNLKKEFLIDFDEATMDKLQKFNKRIDLIHRVRNETKILQKKYVQLVDSTDAISKGESLELKVGQAEKKKLRFEVYTTRHYYAACTIYYYWCKYKEEQKYSKPGNDQGGDKPPSSAPLPSLSVSHSSSELHPERHF